MDVLTLNSASQTVEATYAVGIGTGHVSTNGIVEIGLLVIDDGLFNIRVHEGPCIGSRGASANGGSSVVGSITIRGGAMMCEARQGAVIGSGPSSQGTSRVSSIVIEDDFMNLIAGGSSQTCIGSAVTTASSVVSVLRFDSPSGQFDLQCHPASASNACVRASSITRGNVRISAIV
jgi:hypothetical protein